MYATRRLSSALMNPCRIWCRLVLAAFSAWSPSSFGASPSPPSVRNARALSRPAVLSRILFPGAFFTSVSRYVTVAQTEVSRAWGMGLGGVETLKSHSKSKHHTLLTDARFPTLVPRHPIQPPATYHAIGALRPVHAAQAVITDLHHHPHGVSDSLGCSEH